MSFIYMKLSKEGLPTSEIQPILYQGGHHLETQLILSSSDPHTNLIPTWSLWH